MAQTRRETSNFFFSSRRRHTILTCDWSSDVCSADLNAAIQAQSGGVQAQAAAENALSGTLRQLFALSEAYPDLKANQNFQQLQSELSDIENKLAASRRFYNNAVQEYNTGIQQFPAVLLAGSLGFTPK